MDIYLFDVEQSLAPIGSNMNSEFQSFFIEWMKQKNIMLVALSERTDTVSQIGQTLWESCTRIYQSNATKQYRGHVRSHTNNVGGINGNFLSHDETKIKSDILDDIEYATSRWWINGNIIYFGTDSQTIEKLENEWNNSKLTHTVHQPTTYMNTWDILKQVDHGQDTRTIIEVMLKEVISLRHTGDKHNLFDWESLITSIKNDGLITPLNVRKIITSDHDSITDSVVFNMYKKLYGNDLLNMYTIEDGSHRLRVLKDLYGGDYKIKVNASNTQ